MAAIGDAGLAVGVRATRFTLRRAGFSRTITLLSHMPAPLARRVPDAGAISDWAARIRRVAARPYGATCLDRSVFLWFLMRQRGLAGQMRIGVAFDGDHLDGHAWVEFDGTVVNDDPDIAERFAVFDEDPTGIVFR